MRVKKFEGATMRDAIAKVKAELGDHAVVISSRDVRRGILGSAVEISAAVDDEDDGPDLGGPTVGPTVGPMVAAARPDVDLEKLVAPLRSELRSLRAMIRGAGDTRATTDLRAEVAALRKLLETGVRPEPTAPALPRPLLRSRSGPPLVAGSTSRLVMLVGPTGAGKTTTIAKLAARAALIEKRTVALVTLDNYRVGGVEQARTFAELIGVPLQVAENAAALRDAIDPSDELTLIDTAGRSPRDAQAIAELAELSAGLGIEVHLVIPAATPPALVDQIVARYRVLSPARLLFTKLDEVDLAPDLALAPVRTELPITWITTGQAVPEDLEEPTTARVLELAATGLVIPLSQRRPRAA